jgi:geranyl-CoA carboxylase beta subunit
MPTLSSRLNSASAAFQANAARMRERLEEVLALQAQVVAASAARRETFEARGQLLPRDRIALLLDLVGEVDSADFEPLHAA